MFNNDWTDEKVAELRKLHDQSNPVLSISEIARRMGMSKNAVGGKVRRLKLAVRESPIRRGQTRVRTPKEKKRDALEIIEVNGTSSRAIDADLFLPEPRATKRRKRGCLGGEGDPSLGSYRACTSETLPGSNFCLEHQVCVRKTSDEDDDIRA